MLTGITTRTSTPQEDAELWPGGSARPVLAYLTGTLGMTDADARELLKAARTAQAEAGPGTLADYPVPAGRAHLLIHYAPGSRAYRFNLTAPGNEVPPGTSPEPGTAPGNQPGPDGPPRGRETPDGSPAGDAGGTPAPGLPAPPGGAAQPGRRGSRSRSGTTSPSTRRGGIPPCWTATSPATRWSASSPTRPAAGRSPEEIADEAFDTFNDHPRDPDGADLACAYYGRRLRSLSVGDVVAVTADGEVRLAVAEIGWTPVPGPLTEVRASEHGTRPLPPHSRLPDTADRPVIPGPDQGAT